MLSTDIFSLEEKVIILTGGSGHLGSAMAEAFVQYGATLYIASRNVKRNKSFTEALSKKYNQNVYFVEMDTTDLKSIKSAVDLVFEKEKKVDVLVNNAYNGVSGDILSVTEDGWLDTFNGSINSTYRVVKEVLPIMINQQSGSIINIASMYGVVSPNPEVYGTSGQNNPPHYGASKAAIIQLTRYLASHYGERGIRVNSISPGPFPNLDTQKNKEFITQLSKKTPLGRIGNPEELKGIAVLLASDASSYITGQNILVDGGWTAW